MKYTIEEIFETKCWIIWKGDKSDDNFIAQCESQENADLVCNALNNEVK